MLPVINSHVAIIAARIGLISNFWLYSFLIGSLNFIVSGIILSIIMAPIVWVTRKITDVDSNELFLRAIANLFDLVDKGRSSPAHEYVEECEETFTYNKLVDSNNLLESVRWNVQTPIGENALILVDNINSIKNLNFALQGMDDLVYIDGRVRLRHIVYDVSQPGGMSYRGCFNSEELDPSKYVKEYFPSLKEEEIQKLINTIGKLPPDYKFKKYDFIKNVKKCSPNLREEQISTLIGGYRFKLRVESFINCVKKQHPNLTEAQISELKEKVDFSDTAQYLKYRVMHSMIDLTLSCLMECDNIALDKRRKEDLGKLIEDVKNKVSIVDDNSIIAFLHGKGFREQFAEEKLLPQIKTVIKTLNECSDEQRRLIVDNWHLNKELHNLIEKEGGVLRGLSNFCEENKCIFAKLGKNDLGIKEGEPFFKITFDQKGTKITFDHKSTTYSYCNYKDADLDALAKCALTTIIDGSKGRGFDGEYNHVASIFTDSTSQFNNPAETLQNLGRNREHNSNRQPWFFVAAGEKVELFVDKVLANLKNEPRGFCRKILFPATDRYNKLVKNRMGVELGEKIEIHISENMDVLGNIDDAALKEFLDNSIKEVYKKVHDMNDFDVKKTEKDVHNICKSAEKYLRSCEDRIKNNGKLPFTEKVIFFVASAIIKAIYYIWFAFDYVVFAVKSCTLNEKNDGRNVLAYAYLIKNCSLKKALMYREVSQACEPLWKKIKEDMAKMQLSDAKKFVEKEVDLLQSKAYINTLDKSISSLLSKEEGKKHLLTILDAIYPNQSNKNKLKEIVAFKEDLSRLKYGEMVSKCCKKETDLYSIIQLINNINEEIIKCQAYYHNVNTLIYVDEPKLKTHHDLFNIRVVYSKKTLDDSYGKLHPSHSKLLFLGRLNRVARGVIVLGLFPLLIRPITPIGSLLVSTVLLTLICYQPEVLRKFLFFANIRNDTRSAVNELDLLSKQSEGIRSGEWFKKQ